MQLTKIVGKKSKRLGRGYGSGRGGHTVGRGQKGQKTRGKINVLFEGIKVKKSLLKKLPLRRGKDKLKSKGNPIIVKLSYLNLLPSGSTVSLDLLVKEKIVEADSVKEFGVKILGDGDIKKKLNISVPISKGALKLIEKAGGKLVKA